MNRGMHRQRGVGMMEVLVALLVLGVGVLGFAALQLRSVKASGESYFRSQAMAVAQDLAERIRVNRAQMAAYKTASNWSSAAPTTPPTSCNNTVCTAAALATYDINTVKYVASTQLPAGVVNVETCQASQASCVYVAWDGTAASSGASGQCVNAAGTYVTGANCIMMEFN